MSHRISRRNALIGAGALGLGAAAGGRSAFAQSQEMVFAGWSQTEAGSKPFLDGVFKTFQTNNANVKLEIVGVPFAQMETTLALRKRGGQRTDVAQMQERWLATIAAGGGLLDVDQIFGAAYIDSTFHEASLAMTKVGKARLALPWVSGSTGLVANGKLLAEVGAKVPETIDELVDVMRKVKKAKPNSSPLGITTKNPSLTQLEAQLFFWTFGARFFDDQGKVTIDTDAGRQAMTFLADMVKEGLILPGNDRFDFRRLFAQELVAFYPDPPLARAFARAQSGQGEAYDKYVLPMPTPVLKRGNQPVCIQWGHLLAFYDHGGAKPTADGPVGKFVKHLSDPETQIAYYKATGVFPTAKAALKTLENDSYLVSWVEISRTARPDELVNFSNGNELRTIIGEEITAGMLGQKNSADAIKSMADRLRAANPR